MRCEFAGDNPYGVVIRGNISGGAFEGYDAKAWLRKGVPIERTKPAIQIGEEHFGIIRTFWPVVKLTPR